MKSPNNYFPSQAVSDIEKVSYDYGLKIAKAIEAEWFYNGNNGQNYYSRRYTSNGDTFRSLRLYARGEQPIQKYKDELSINGDLSYLNLDWKPVPIIPKFVDIVVNGMTDKDYSIKAHSQDPYGASKRTEYMESILKDMKLKELKDFSLKELGVNMYENNPETLPDSVEELGLHMQLSYKQEAEIAQEQALNVLLKGNKFDLIKRRFFYDLAVIGIGAVKTNFNTSEGLTVDYVDPANMVYSYTESPFFEDIYYVGEVKEIPVNELAKQFPFLSQQDLEDITNKNYNRKANNRYSSQNKDNNIVQVLYFNYKTYMNNVYKVKETSVGLERAIEKDDSFNPPNSENFQRISKQVEVLYEGAYVLGAEKLLKWEMCKNMIRPKSDYTKVKMNYSIVAPRMYENRIESIVSRITGFADMIQLTHLKIQQVMSKIIPDGIYLDADGLAEIDLGNGTNYNPQEALNMFFQTGSVIGRSMTQDGDMNPGKVPIQEIRNSNGGSKMQALIGNYNYYLQMIRDTTGLNEARDGSTPDKNALVGLQKLAAQNSNTATRHILQAGMFLVADVLESMSLRISDILEFSPTKEAFIQAIGSHSVANLEEISKMHLYDFGIFLQVSPDEDEKQRLENNIQMSIQQQTLDLEDAIDIRQIKNLKLANQVLKIRRKKKMEAAAAAQKANMDKQAQTNAQQQQLAAQLEQQKHSSKAQADIQVEQAKAQFKEKEMNLEVELKKQLMALEFQYNQQIQNAQSNNLKSREKEKEDRKDERTKIQASQQSELIDQRKTGGSPKKFESSGNDILGSGFGLEAFAPK
mgnify:CR=1 FL=1|tara:strand:- start:1909 stop:4326 length:2418 start_codon:yes stop_codon:yes gene_type:complete